MDGTIPCSGAAPKHTSGQPYATLGGILVIWGVAVAAAGSLGFAFMAESNKAIVGVSAFWFGFLILALGMISHARDGGYGKYSICIGTSLIVGDIGTVATSLFGFFPVFLATMLAGGVGTAVFGLYIAFKGKTINW